MNKEKPARIEEIAHSHPDGRRCCGRLLSEKCSPEEEAGKVNPETGKKSCCRGHHHK